jgi:anti-repressor protein
MDTNTTGVQIFKHPLFGEIRTAGSSNEPLFCLSDICKAVSLTNPSSVIKRLDNDEIIKYNLGRENQRIGNSIANYVTEGGFYNVLLFSSSPNVKPFRKWVTSEVLPAIRKHGGYMIATPEETPEEIMARALVLAQRTIENIKSKAQRLEGEKDLLQEENKSLAPKAGYTDEVLQSTSTFTLTQVSHDLDLRSVYVLTKWLSEKGILFYQSGQWQPTSKVAGMGYFTTRTAKYIKNDNTIGTTLSTVVTEKGRMFLHGMLRKGGLL